jgi:xanthine dehydrogenase YagS FAD-binding subunit
MQNFQFNIARTVSDAVSAGARSQTSQQGAQVRFIAGGTTLLDLMKLDVEVPRQVVDINRLPLDQVEPISGGGLKIGALARNSDVAENSVVKRDYAVLSQALLSGASPQLRNMATTGGNLLQRTRCGYFRDTAYPCNKREPGSGCAAIGGYNRMLAILGTSEHCIATNPSDQNVALTALEATIYIQGAKGARAVPIDSFFVVPGATPQRENVLEPGDLITHAALPALPENTRSYYVKLRDRAAYEFALASAAVVITMDGGRIRRARVALGGVGTKPWRSVEAEKALEGKTASEETFRTAAREALKDARPASENGFKVELAQRCLVRTLQLATTNA